MYIKIHNEKVAYVDCDHTLIEWSPLKEVAPLTLVSPKGCHNVYPMQKNIDLIRELRAVGWEIIVWSQGGVEHAERVVKLLKIEDLVDVIVSKPSLYVDDLPLEQQNLKRVFKSEV